MTNRRVAAVSYTAIVLAIAGCFGTWRSAGNVSLDGLEGPHNGWIVIIFALISLAGVRALVRGSWLGIVTVLGGAAAMIFTAVENVVDDNAVLGGSSGWGVWLTIVASAALAGTALAVAVSRLRGSTQAGPRTSP
jgi:hypothetical protein